MKLGKCEVTHFGSYRHLSFDFRDTGLALVQGPTGSGKSTLPDIPAWILFGITSKDGLSDDVRSWTSDGEPTQGRLQVFYGARMLDVVRVRGKSSQNDLYFYDYGDMEHGPAEPTRGKDLTETQRLLSDRLGIDATTFVTGSYFSEFSPSARFFLAGAKDRRALFERIAPLEFPKTVSESAGKAKSAANKELIGAQQRLSAAIAKSDQLFRSKESASADSKEWQTTQAKRLAALETQSTNFEAHKASAIAANQTRVDAFTAQQAALVDKLAAEVVELEALLEPETAFKDQETAIRAQHTCSGCKGLKGSAETLLAKVRKAEEANAARVTKLHFLSERLEQIKHHQNPHLSALESSKATENTFTAALEQARATENPYLKQVKRLSVELKEALGEKVVAQAGVALLRQKVDDLDLIQDLCTTARGALLAQAVSNIQDRTNAVLERHFDAPIRVEFEVDSDNLSVSIFKNGHSASYSQLSKGQRQLLKLSFAVSVMEASANKAGVHFDNLFFDEALDGLDTDLKLKAHSLFLELSKNHANLLVIDHSEELKQQFDKRYTVRLEGDESLIESESD